MKAGLAAPPLGLWSLSLWGCESGQAGPGCSNEQPRPQPLRTTPVSLLVGPDAASCGSQGTLWSRHTMAPAALPSSRVSLPHTLHWPRLRSWRAVGMDELQKGSVHSPRHHHTLSLGVLPSPAPTPRGQVCEASTWWSSRSHGLGWAGTWVNVGVLGVWGPWR